MHFGSDLLTKHGVSLLRQIRNGRVQQFGGHKAVVRPDPIPNSAVKRSLADGSGCIASARVGRRQSFKQNPEKSSPGFAIYVINSRHWVQRPHATVDQTPSIEFCLRLNMVFTGRQFGVLPDEYGVCGTFLFAKRNTIN